MAKKAKKELSPEERLAAACVPKEEWPYELPEGWEWVRLEGVADIINGDRGKNYPSKKDYQSSGIPFINAGAIQENKLCVDEFNYISELKYNSLRSGKVAKGDILYCLRGSLGKVAIVDIDCPGAISSSLCILRTNEYILEKYFYYLLRSYVIERQQMSVENGSAQPNLSAASVKAYALPLPPQETQQRIVNRIEGLFAKLDQAKEKAQHALATSETRKAAILHQAFTGQLTAQWRQEHGVSMDSWEKVKLQDVCEKITDGTHHSPENLPEGEYMYVTAKNIKESGIDLTNITYVSKEVHDEIYSRCDVKFGDVLYIKDGATTGIATVNNIEEPFSLLSSVAVLRPMAQRLNPHYLAFNLNSSETKAMMINNMSGNAITRLTLKKIKDAEIMICSLEEQQEIVHILDTLMANEQRIHQAIETILQQIDDTKKSILAKAFRGEWQ